MSNRDESFSIGDENTRNKLIEDFINALDPELRAMALNPMSYDPSLERHVLSLKIYVGSPVAQLSTELAHTLNNELKPTIVGFLSPVSVSAMANKNMYLMRVYYAVKPKESV